MKQGGWHKVFNVILYIKVSKCYLGLLSKSVMLVDIECEPSCLGVPHIERSPQNSSHVVAYKTAACTRHLAGSSSVSRVTIWPLLIDLLSRSIAKSVQKLYVFLQRTSPSTHCSIYASLCAKIPSNIVSAMCMCCRCRH